MIAMLAGTFFTLMMWSDVKILFPSAGYAGSSRGREPVAIRKFLAVISRMPTLVLACFAPTHGWERYVLLLPVASMHTKVLAAHHFAHAQEDTGMIRLRMSKHPSIRENERYCPDRALFQKKFQEIEKALLKASLRVGT